MTTITDQLAEALRRIQRATVFSPDGDDVASITIKRGSSEWIAMDKAIAAYDAQRERHPDTDAFMAAADGALNSYYQMTDEPIDRVDDGAWVTVRMFVTNEEAGLSTGEED